MLTFKELGVDQRIIKAIEELGFAEPMPIQEKVIPHLMEENVRDLVGIAQTGTGKTAAFGIPLIQNTNTSTKKTQYLVIAPTRELCLQIADDILSYSKYYDNLNVAAIFGGASIDRQIAQLKKGAHIISATPGRLVDMINRGAVNLKHIKTVVLDEADEMLNMGFRDELEEILKQTPKEKNTLLFSATMPNAVMKIAKTYMKDFVEISAGKKNIGAENITHLCYMVHAKDRYQALKRIVDFNPNLYGIVFCRTRAETQVVADHLMRDGYNAESLHGDLSQAQRNAVMQKFRIKNLNMLVATDVAARGLDVDDLTHIINYNLPDESELYIHRSGRTGRAGKAGISILLANLREKSRIAEIEKKLGKKFEYKPIPQGKEIVKKQLFQLVDRIEKVEVDYSEIEPFLPEIKQKLEWLDRDELIKKFISTEFNRFLDYYKGLPDLNVPGEKGGGGRTGKPGLGFTRFFINLGKTDGLKPTTIIGMINDYTGKRNIDIGAIEIQRNFSFFETDSEYADLILKSFQNKNLKGRDIAVEVAASKGGGSPKRKSRRTDRPDKRRDSSGKGDRRRKRF